MSNARSGSYLKGGLIAYLGLLVVSGLLATRYRLFAQPEDPLMLVAVTWQSLLLLPWMIIGTPVAARMLGGARSGGDAASPTERIRYPDRVRQTWTSARDVIVRRSKIALVGATLFSAFCALYATMVDARGSALLTYGLFFLIYVVILGPLFAGLTTIGTLLSYTPDLAQAASQDRVLRQERDAVLADAEDMVGALDEVQGVGPGGGLELTAEAGSLEVEQEVFFDLGVQEEAPQHAQVEESLKS